MLPDFKRLITFNHIDDRAMKIASRNMTYSFFKKGDIICKEGDESNCFFGVIQGKVSLRKLRIREVPNPNYYQWAFPPVPKVFITEEEEELQILSDGQYFGEYGVIEDKPRRASAYALEDCHLFLIDKANFNKSIGVLLIYLEMYIKD